MATSNDSALVERLRRRTQAKLGIAFRAFVAQTLAGIGSGETRSKIEAGDLAALYAVADRAAAQFAGAWATAFTESGGDVATFLSRAIGVSVVYDVTNDSAVTTLRTARFRLIREITQEQRAAIGEALTEGTRLGLNPREQARLFRESIGLTRRQMAAVANYRRLLTEGDAAALTRQLRDRRFDPTVRAAISGQGTLSRTQVEKMTARYRERFLAYRATTIARTESLRAVHLAAADVYRQAIEANDLAPSDVRREWQTAKDERVRTSHAAMHGQVRAIGEPFLSGDGYALAYPGDENAPASETINCRCRVGTRVDVSALLLT